MKDLSLENIQRLDAVFAREEWERCDFLDFERYCKYVKLFEPEEQNLIVELSERFELLGEERRRKLLRKALEALANSELFKRFSTRIALPFAVFKDDERGGMSADAMLYCLKEMNDIQGLGLGIAKRFDATMIKKPSCTMVCLVDDYIGTGGSILGAIERFERESGLAAADRVAVLAIAAQREGVRRVKEECGAEVYVGIELVKGISDCYADPSVPLSIMDSLEKRIGVNDCFKRGFGGSEALVRLQRTPNNVFPVFWLPKEKSKLELDPPFCRRG